MLYTSESPSDQRRGHEAGMHWTVWFHRHEHRSFVIMTSTHAKRAVLGCVLPAMSLQRPKYSSLVTPPDGVEQRVLLVVVARATSIGRQRRFVPQALPHLATLRELEALQLIAVGLCMTLRNTNLARIGVAMPRWWPK